MTIKTWQEIITLSNNQWPDEDCMKAEIEELRAELAESCKALYRIANPGAVYAAPVQPAPSTDEVIRLYDELAQKTLALPADLIIKALRAINAEARKRGAMYPQTLDEQGEDTKAVRNVIASLEFYTSKNQCSNGWPGVKDWPALPSNPTAALTQPALTDEVILETLCLFNHDFSMTKTRIEVGRAIEAAIKGGAT